MWLERHSVTLKLMEPERVEQLTRTFFNALPWWVRLLACALVFSSLVASVASVMVAWSLVTLVQWNFG